MGRVRGRRQIGSMGIAVAALLAAMAGCPSVVEAAPSTSKPVTATSEVPDSSSGRWPSAGSSAQPLAQPSTRPATGELAGSAGSTPDSDQIGVAVNGVDVLKDEPSKVADVAQTHGLTTEEAEDLLKDSSVWVRPNGQVYFADPLPARPDDNAGGVPQTNSVVPLSSTFSLHSRPGSKRTIYLDFNGQLVSNTYWKNGDIAAVPYDTDGQPTFSASELSDIQDIWQRVAEDFAALDVDVTTQDPGTAALRRDSTSDLTYGTRVVITDTEASEVTDLSAAGVAHFDAFNSIGIEHDKLQPAWVFSNGLYDNPKYIGEAVSHEVGHTLGLEHDGGNGDGEYYGGHGGLWAPIMGVAYETPMSQWSKGEYVNASNKEDDFAVMASRGAVAIADDHTNVTATASSLTSSLAGNITTASDKDLFKYVATSTGTWTFSAETTSSATNLDIKLTLLSASGSQLATADPAVTVIDEAHASGLDASISHSVVAGTTYYLRVEPTSVGTASTGYTTYGTVGTYFISASNQPLCTALDTVEPDSLDEARVATSGQALAGRICRGDVDYVGLPVKAGQPISLGLNFTHANGDLDLTLFDPTGATVGTSGSTSNNETINHTATKSGVYVAEIAGKTRSVVNTYTLTMTSALCPGDDNFENNDTLGTAKTLQVGVTYNAVACPGDPDFFTFPVHLDTGYEIEVDSLSRYGSLEVSDFDSDGTILQTSGGEYPNDEILVWDTAYARSSARFRVQTTGNANVYTIRVVRGPEAPTGVAVTAGHEYANVSWNAPTADGGSPVNSYVVEAIVDGYVISSNTTTGSPASVGFLTTGTPTTIQVRAVNEVSQGAPSAPVIVTPTAGFTAPGIPDHVAVNASGDGGLMVSWDPPSSDGGSPITSYVVTPYVGGVAKPAVQMTEPTYEAFPGLIPGTTYTFKVAAKNALGTGTQSPATDPAKVPPVPPGAPTGVSATAGVESATVKWNAPSNNGGSPITAYEVSVLVGGAEQYVETFAPTATQQVLTDLSSGVTYTFKVAAVNDAGIGALSAASNAVKPTAPLAPYAPFGSWSALIRRQFMDVAAQEPSASSMSSWMSQLITETKSKGDLVDALRRGTDNTQSVDPGARLYRAFMGRIPDAGGLKFWVARRRTGAWSLYRMADYFAGSNEFKTRYGSLTNRQFATLIYTDVMGRAADSGGVNFWTSQLDSKKKTRGQVMVGFSESNEYKNKQAENTDVAVAYVFLLGRAPTTAQSDAWVVRQKAGTPHATLLTEVLDSAEYASHITG
ncbi:MAG: fibronectin type III domain-containing protein [Acidimicrobiales bacterium]|nr:fibronectin type III domain-containing protein [Acidimicrobiales bacterium]